MEILIYEENGQKIGQVIGDEIIIAKTQDALDLMVDSRLEGSRKIIIDRKNIIPEFFDLSTRIAGEILQKFVTYQIKLAIIGDFSKEKSEALKAFIYESNRGNQIFFASDVETAQRMLLMAK